MADAASVYDFEINTIAGESTTLAAHADKVLLIVNVASECGLTPQYTGLQALYDEYKDQGLVVAGFPANNFGAQEPGPDDAILEFCTSRFAVNFPMYAKVSVKGDDIDPLFDFLTGAETNPQCGGEIQWNFNKFLIGKDGSILGRFEPKVEPDDETVIAAIQAAL